MQNVLGYSPIQAGAAYLPLTFGVGVAAGIASQLLPRVGTRPVIVGGSLIGAGGVYWLSRIPVDGSYVTDLLPGLVITSLGLGAMFVAVLEAANAGVGEDRAGLAAALLNASQQVGARSRTGDLHRDRDVPHRRPAGTPRPRLGGTHVRLPARAARVEHLLRRGRARGHAHHEHARRAGGAGGRARIRRATSGGAGVARTVRTPGVSGESVLVTGGSGFIGSYCILDLLRAGYRVRTTVRSPDREATVRELLGAESAEALSFATADLMADAGWARAVAGCDYVLHVASPFPLGPPKHEDDLIVPAREGALRVLARRA